jgi:hypothetical protein
MPCDHRSLSSRELCSRRRGVVESEHRSRTSSGYGVSSAATPLRSVLRAPNQPRSGSPGSRGIPRPRVGIPCQTNAGRDAASAPRQTNPGRVPPGMPPVLRAKPTPVGCPVPPGCPVRYPLPNQPGRDPGCPQTAINYLPGLLLSRTRYLRKSDPSSERIVSIARSESLRRSLHSGFAVHQLRNSISATLGGRDSTMTIHCGSLGIMVTYRM